MQRPLSFVLSLIFAWHAMLGCCWHHAHAETDSGCVSGAHLSADPCTGHHHEEAGEEPGSEHPAPDPCDEPSCLFVRSDNSPTSDSFALLPTFDFVSGQTAAACQEQTFATRRAESPPPPFGPALLRTVVLLI